MLSSYYKHNTELSTPDVTCRYNKELVYSDILSTEIYSRKTCIHSINMSISIELLIIQNSGNYIDEQGKILVLKEFFILVEKMSN